MSLHESAYFKHAFYELYKALICPLLWWWYADNMACSSLINLQNCQNLSATKVVLTSDIIF